MRDPFWTDVMVPDEETFLDMTETRASMFDDPVVQVGRVPRLTGTTVEFV